MATGLQRGAGTEIVRCVNLQDVDSSSWYNLINGEQYHIYTILSVVVFAESLVTAGNKFQLRVYGYDVKEGATTDIMVCQTAMTEKETFVFNDKFSMNGFEPVDFTHPLNTPAEQNAVADQEGTGTQYFQCSGTAPDDDFHVICTFIDQNNAP